MSAYSAAVLATSGLVAYLRLGEASGTAADATGHGHTGTVTGSLYGATGLLTGDSDKAYTFPGGGATGKVTLSDAAGMLGTGAFSVEAWIRIPTWSANACIVDRQGGVGGGYAMALGVSGTIDCYIYTSSFQTASSTGWALNTTYHFVLTYDGSTALTYRNGTQVGTASFAGAVNNNGANTVIGQNQNDTTTFNGTIDEVALYNTALSAATVLNHYTIGATGIDPNAVTGPPVGLMLPI